MRSAQRSGVEPLRPGRAAWVLALAFACGTTDGSIDTTGASDETGSGSTGSTGVIDPTGFEDPTGG